MNDPDLREIELNKRRAARKRRKRAHFHRVRVEAFYAIKESLLIFTLGALTTVAILAMTVIFFCLA